MFTIPCFRVCHLYGDQSSSASIIASTSSSAGYRKNDNASKEDVSEQFLDQQYNKNGDGGSTSSKSSAGGPPEGNSITSTSTLSMQQNNMKNHQHQISSSSSSFSDHYYPSLLPLSASSSSWFLTTTTATSRAPQFPPAHCGLSEYRSTPAGFTWPPSIMGLIMIFFLLWLDPIESLSLSSSSSSLVLLDQTLMKTRALNSYHYLRSSSTTDADAAAASVAGETIKGEDTSNKENENDMPEGMNDSKDEHLTNANNHYNEDSSATSLELAQSLPVVRLLLQRDNYTNTSNNNNHYISSFNISCTEQCCQQTFPMLTGIMKNTTTNCNQTCADTTQTEQHGAFHNIPFGVQILLIVFCILMSAMFSGLTLGMVGLDRTGLEIVMGGDGQDAIYARTIAPLRQDGNLLLTTLVLGNIAVNSLASILLADKTGGVVGFITSTLLIVIFGEIIPQAICSRYPLYIGSRLVPLVYIIRMILFPITKPLSMSLDFFLGEELTTTYSTSEMVKLLQIHVNENKMDHETAITMKGALTYRDRSVRDVMTPLENTFMLSADEKLSFETIAKIFKTGYSRIPVYQVDKNNVIGLLFVKDLIFLDPEDETRVKDFVDIFGRGVHVVWPDDKLGDVLRELRTGRSHMALVRDVNDTNDSQDPFYEVKGIITLEDIIEEILGTEIVDETDAFVDGTHSQRVDRAETMSWARLRLLDSKIVDETLSYHETSAVAAYLQKNYSHVVRLLTDYQLSRLIAETPVQLFPTSTQQLDQDLPTDLLYEKGVVTDVCTLILAGKVTVLVGADCFRSDVSSWCLLGAGALEHRPYSPDFTAYVSSGPCRCVQITRTRFDAAVDASAVERKSIKPGSGGAAGAGGGTDGSSVSLLGLTNTPNYGSTTTASLPDLRLPPPKGLSSVPGTSSSVGPDRNETDNVEGSTERRRKEKLLTALQLAQKGGVASGGAPAGGQPISSTQRSKPPRALATSLTSDKRDKVGQGSHNESSERSDREFEYISSSGKDLIKDESKD